ncbi:hypothetical protein QFZ37_000556 [Chryseobacterium ginsenosidimutans]|uniref:ORC-CDC6 family AAA ATPase n=1 Tax=Chryseobacterium ginsenosidimutans TaxID=687846 RepID=UPI0027820E80|nr:hypothetical protein [Chryseobacterium ginsenosidimutans]MDQ0592187.1 hypothetical protein [Chryseobacterium ginsenosidimutans]
MENPFEYKNPDAISPKDIIDLFVPVFGEYYNIPLIGHTFINGARGSGKSMMFRYMMPECQRLVNKRGEKLDEPRKITDLEYFSIFLPIKKGHLNKTDIQLNESHGDALLNEHFMVAHFSLVMFDELSKLEIDDDGLNLEKLKLFYNEVFVEELIYCGFENEDVINIEDAKSIKDVFKSIIKTLKIINKDFQKDYINKLVNTNESVPYNGCILSYSDFLTVIIKEFRQLPFMPNDKPIFLLIDDADELSIIQRKILNSWVAVRSTDVISLKISTQLKYKVFSTVNGSRIDTPHDYSEINMNDIYTTKRGLYYDRVKAVVEKRLQRYTDDPILAEDFFMEDSKQKEKIAELFNQLKEQQLQRGLDSDQAYDYAYRYTTPIYITNLGGNRSTFSYSGFKQLVNISTGIIREFIDFSSDMFEEAISSNKGEKLKFISPSIQNDKIRKYSEQRVIYEFDKYKDEVEVENKVDMDKLRNLIHGMGELFKMILISDQSERRVFSVALNDEPSDELKKILDLGVSTGYLQKSMIGNKEGTGRARLYILNRALSPFFGLDPSSFAGYKFMNSSVLEIALTNKKQFLNSFKKKLLPENDNTFQGTLKFEEE